MWTKDDVGTPVTAYNVRAFRRGWVAGIMMSGEGAYWSTQRDATDSLPILWRHDEGVDWARGHGPDVEAALLLTRSVAR